MSEQLQAQTMPDDPPFELKQRIIRMIVDEIVLDVSEGWLQVSGAARGQYQIVNTPALAVTSATQLSPVPAHRR